MATLDPRGEPSSWDPAMEPVSWNADSPRRHDSTGRRPVNPDFNDQGSPRPSPYTGPTRSASLGSSRRPLRPASQDGYHSREAESPGGPRRPESLDPVVRRYGSQSRPPRAHANRGFGVTHGDFAPRDEPQDIREGPFLDARSEPRRHYNDIDDRPHPARENFYRQDEEMGRMRYERDDEYAGGFYDNPRPYRGRGGGLGWENMTKDEKREILRLPWIQWLDSNIKNHFVAAVGEFVGTTMFLFFAFAGTEVANTQSRADDGSQTTTGAATGFDVGVLVYIALSFGFSLMVNVWVFFRISGGLFNPAVTLGMMLVKAVSPVRAAWLLLGQLGGGIAASALVMVLFPAGFNVRTTLGSGASLVQGIFIEAMLTAELVFTIFMLAKEKHRATFMAPIGIGLALFIAELVGVQYTGGSLNPARSFGPCVVTATFDAEHWIYCKAHLSFLSPC